SAGSARTGAAALRTRASAGPASSAGGGGVRIREPVACQAFFLRRFWLGRFGVIPASTSSARLVSANSASPSRSGARLASSPCTSTRSPCSAGVFAVAGPQQQSTEVAAGRPAIPTGLRTAGEEVKRKASESPALIDSRIGAGGGEARTVR